MEDSTLVGSTALYESRINRFQSEKKALEAVSGRVALARFTLFLLMAITVWLSFRLKSGALAIVPVLCLAAFLYLVRRAVNIRRRIEYSQMLITINREEIMALGGDFTAFDPGTELIDYHHEYSYDLDIFGVHSIFQLVNRVATPLGKVRLAGRLASPGTGPAVIRQRQDAARELRDKVSWRQDFLATARQSDWENLNKLNFRQWLDAPDQFSSNRFYGIALRINSVLTIGITLLFILPAFLPAIFRFACPPALLLYFLAPISLIISRTRLINQEQQKLERLLELFRKYTGMLHLIENEEFTSIYLNDLKRNLTLGDTLSSQIMKKLTGILWGLEVRGNMIVSFILNSYFLWDILQIIRLERWRTVYREAFGHWIDTIAEFETVSSLANLSFNRPDLVWPEILEGPFRMEVVDGGHPLIDPLKRVDNSLKFDGDGRLYLVTGANMAGKSTLLRMAGVNMILAMAGGPVCAARFSLVPISIHTSVRTNDSLGDDESYFYAELKKLGSIINRFNQGEKLFVIIDEMLKGTNSHDKHAGSAALIHRLVDLGASGLIATHDVGLGELEQLYPGRLENRCFEVIIENDHLKFDYILHPGISKNLNATFLMRKMGIIREVSG